jgi:hypothetical protein
MRAARLRRHPPAEAEDTMDVIVGLVIMYFALMIFPLILKLFGLGFIADPLIKLINSILLLPLRLIAAMLRRG